MPEYTDPEQPNSGQDGQGADAPYSEYLNRIPEELRADVEPVFRDWDANTTRKFQEAAEQRKSWEPYEELGINQRDPGELEWAMRFVDTLQNPEAIKEWYGEYARERGLADQAETDEYIDPSVSDLVQRQLSAQLGPVAQQLAEISQWRDAQEQQRAEAEAMGQIKSEISSLKAKHGDAFNEQMVEKLLPQYIDSDPQHAVQRAFADWQSIRASVEQDWTSGKANQPPAAMSGGTASGQPDPPPKGEALKYAAQQALEQLRIGRQG